ncbi:MAG: hypothetical protein JAY77_10620 [Candidatus Thiodiazotropha taylori]|uniref:DNA polymerase Y-family little finger domain-containing protein n=1 Tax=Candidatus Thiodiazotropha taylori TaxID=2792791 RepID=A0A9E4NKL3_9GAMM|nr:hypothetical protein [Candidatus Thiodiazotropha taylori]
MGSLLTVKIRFQGFETHTRCRTLPTPTAVDLEIFRQAWALYRVEDWEERPVRLIGLGIGVRESDAYHLANQGDLFDEMTSELGPKQDSLYATVLVKSFWPRFYMHSNTVAQLPSAPIRHCEYVA